MSKVNYDEISRVYDSVRRADIELINSFCEELDIQPGTTILDVGCGTGNHTDALQKLTRARVYGVEPSGGMIRKAREKNAAITFAQGDAAHIPYGGGFFDFVYMTDVVHHVPDIAAMFAELQRVLRPGGKVCIATQSHAQIAARPIAHFFPGTVAVDQARYPDIPNLIEAAERQNFAFRKAAVLYENEERTLDGDFLALVRKKGYSMLHLIAEEEYRAGLHMLEAALANGPIWMRAAGETLAWFVRRAG